MILATGGLGNLYAATTNPAGSTGDGVALAMWAGLAVSDIEFIQFHPTMLFDGHAGGRRPLITEAVRGEGAVLVDRQGNSVTAGVHPMGDLAPRDVVAGAIDARMAATGDPCVYLDAQRHRGLQAAVSDRHRGVPGGGYRSDPRAHPGGAGCALQLRRRGHRCVRPYRTRGSVRRGRGGPHRYARRKPVGVQQPARRAGRRWQGRTGGGRPCRRCRADACRARRTVRTAGVASSGLAAGDDAGRIGGS